MASKMMRQDGRRRGAPEAMRKAAGQMGEAQGHPHMERMMGMRRPSEMLESMHQTSVLAVHATPEQQAFAEWLRELDERAVGLLAKGKADGAQLARSLKIIEASALPLLHRPATSGKVNLVAELKNQQRS